MVLGHIVWRSWTSEVAATCLIIITVLFSVFQNFLIFKRRDIISWGESILQEGSITWFPLLYFKLKNMKIPNSASFIRFQCVLHDPGVLLWVFQSFLKFNKGDLIAFREPILHKSWIIWSSLLYFRFKILKDPNSVSFITFQYILHDAAVLFSVYQKKFKFRERHLISWGEPILQNGWIIWSPLLYFKLKIWRTQTLRHLLDINGFYMMEQFFSRYFKICSNSREGPNFLEGPDSAEQLNYLVPPFCISN